MIGHRVRRKRVICDGAPRETRCQKPATVRTGGFSDGKSSMAPRIAAWRFHLHAPFFHAAIASRTADASSASVVSAGNACRQQWWLPLLPGLVRAKVHKHAQVHTLAAIPEPRRADRRCPR